MYTKCTYSMIRGCLTSGMLGMFHSAIRKAKEELIGELSALTVVDCTDNKEQRS